MRKEAESLRIRISREPRTELVVVPHTTQWNQGSQSFLPVLSWGAAFIFILVSQEWHQHEGTASFFSLLLFPFISVFFKVTMYLVIWRRKNILLHPTFGLKKQQLHIFTCRNIFLWVKSGNCWQWAGLFPNNLLLKTFTPYLKHMMLTGNGIFWLFLFPLTFWTVLAGKIQASFSGASCRLQLSASWSLYHFTTVSGSVWSNKFHSEQSKNPLPTKAWYIHGKRLATDHPHNHIKLTKMDGTQHCHMTNSRSSCHTPDNRPRNNWIQNRVHGQIVTWAERASVTSGQGDRALVSQCQRKAYPQFPLLCSASLFHLFHLGLANKKHVTSHKS